MNTKITAASKDKYSPLYKVPPVVDPSNEMAEVLVQALEWNMLSREWNLNVRDLALLHQKSKALLQTLKTHLPDRVGGAKGWNFEKAHSILHKYEKLLCGVGLKIHLARALNMHTLNSSRVLHI